jgi:hypothetical protein
MMMKKRILLGIVLTLVLLCGSLYAQEPPDNAAVIRYNGIEFSYAPEFFGAVLPGYEEGTPYQTDAPYFANVAPHTTFKFMRPNPTRPDVNWVGELSVYRMADIDAYAEPSYKDVVAQLQNLDIGNLNIYATVGADYKIPSLPFMPVLNATQVFRAHPHALDFDTARGIEYYTYYSQSAEPIFEGQVLYTYQGITRDGMHYLSFSMPIETGFLETVIADDMDWNAFMAHYSQYLEDTFATINNADSASYLPSSAVFHSFIQSIAINGE